MEAMIKCSQKETKATIGFVWPHLEETIKNRVEDVLPFVDQQTQSPRKELDARIGETQLELQTS
jgi:hypothetical protein